MERINDYGIMEVVCDHCGTRIYDSDELAIINQSTYHGACYLEWRGNDEDPIDLNVVLQRGASSSD